MLLFCPVFLHFSQLVFPGINIDGQYDENETRTKNRISPHDLKLIIISFYNVYSLSLQNKVLVNGEKKKKRNLISPAYTFV